MNDLLKAIAETPDLDGWRIVMTMREENAQCVNGWLDPDANARPPSRSIHVEGFNNEEVAEAAAAIPGLRLPLADSRSYNTVLRRPFFLDALLRLPIASGSGIRSEVDLVELWWVTAARTGPTSRPPRGGGTSCSPLATNCCRNLAFRSPSGTLTRPR